MTKYLTGNNVKEEGVIRFRVAVHSALGMYSSWLHCIQSQEGESLSARALIAPFCLHDTQLSILDSEMHPPHLFPPLNFSRNTLTGVSTDMSPL